VHVVDDDEAIRRSLDRLLRSASFHPVFYDSPYEFLGAAPSLTVGCVLLDLRLGEISGLDVQARLNQMGFTLPVIVMTAYGDVRTAVQAIKAGAVEFIEKPLDTDYLLATLEVATERVNISEGNAEVAAAKKQIIALSPRERDVLERLMAGRSNKTIAFNLGISVRTVEIHRARMLKRLGVRSLGEAVRIAVLARR
jgi:two-component system response regulator FixJ